MEIIGESAVIQTIQHLPQEQILDVGAFSRLFKNTATAYKYLFFQAIIHNLESHMDDTNPITLLLEDLAVEMVVIGWYPLRFFHLSFGIQDQVGKIIERLQFSLDEKSIINPESRIRLRSAILEQRQSIGLDQLLDFVPYRLLTPFFSKELKGIKEQQKNNFIRQLAADNFDTHISLYRFVSVGERSAIELHPKWVKYLTHHVNIHIIKSWAMWEWVCYLQARNPNIPAIINKIAPPLKRAPLTLPTRFWREVMVNNNEIQCIYSGQRFNGDNFSLDHFLPWSFVCHDQAWNLCPVTHSANSSKSNRLPAKEYIELFVRQQHHALLVGADILSAPFWEKLTSAYMLDLRLDERGLLNEDKLRTAYQATFGSLMTLAEQSGFEADWLYC